MFEPTVAQIRHLRMLTESYDPVRDETYAVAPYWLCREALIATNGSVNDAIEYMRLKH